MDVQPAWKWALASSLVSCSGRHAEPQAGAPHVASIDALVMPRPPATDATSRPPPESLDRPQPSDSAVLTAMAMLRPSPRLLVRPFRIGAGRYLVISTHLEPDRLDTFAAHTYAAIVEDQNGSARVDASIELLEHGSYVGSAGMTPIPVPAGAPRTAPAPSVEGLVLDDLDRDGEPEVQFDLHYCQEPASPDGLVCRVGRFYLELIPNLSVATIVDLDFHAAMFNRRVTDTVEFLDVNGDGHPDLMARVLDCSEGQNPPGRHCERHRERWLWDPIEDRWAGPDTL